MPPDKDFPLNYVDFNDYSDQDSTPGVKTAKALTFLGASAMSALCYVVRSRVINTLQNDDRFDLVRKHDVLSHIFPLANISGKAVGEDADSQEAPLMAWSNPLQLVFLSFPGTKDVGDILSDINILQAPDDDKASRFHQGFYNRAYQYVPLVRHLIQRYRVVLCGHSLGGAIATIAAYHAVTNAYNQPVHNTWEHNCQHNDQGFSIITFGAPTPMVVESSGTTACLHTQFTKNFHHLMNPDDPIPFLPNHALALLKNIKETLDKTLGAFMVGYKFYVEVLTTALRVWKGGIDKFAHFGRLYILTVHGGASKTFVCLPVAHEHHLSRGLYGEIGEKRYHAMDHYNFCIRMVFLGESLEALPPSEHQQFYLLRQYCLPFPDPIRGGVSSIRDNKVGVTFAIQAPLAPYFISRVTFRRGDREKEVTTFTYDSPVNQNQAILSILEAVGPDEGAEELLETADSLEGTLAIQDSFGYQTCLIVERREHPFLKDLNMLDTGESLQQVMIAAFADQIQRVHLLRMDRDPQAQPARLTPKSQAIAGIIDELVSSAMPFLILLNFKKSLAESKDIWNFEESKGQEPPDEQHESALELGTLKRLLPTDCDDTLADLLASMLISFKRENKAVLKSRMLRDVNPGLVSFEQSLKDFSQGLYDRPQDDEDDRIQLAIGQVSELLGVMHFCHFVLLTQMSAPPWWFFQRQTLSSKALLPFVISSSSVSIFIDSVRLLPAPLLGLASGIASATATLLLLVGYDRYQDRMVKRQPIQQDYNEILKLTAQVLRLSHSWSNRSLEFRIEEKLRGSEGEERGGSRLSRWTDALRAGLVGLPWNTGLFVSTPMPSIFWAQWLFRVGKTGELRRFVSEKTNIGVMGPTDTGKSELLSVLTSAPEDFFSPGSRTMEVQSYSPGNYTGVFHDCPGFDDETDSVKVMARLFQNIFNILIIVLDSHKLRAEGTKNCQDKVIKMLKSERDHRPIRILLSKVDSFDCENPQKFTKSILEAKREVVKRFRAELGNDFTIRSRRAVQGPSDTSIVMDIESLEDIVQPFSTHAQMSDMGKRALCDCEPGTQRKIWNPNPHRQLYQLANEGTIWDIVSLRQWLRGFSSNIVPSGTRHGVEEQRTSLELIGNEERQPATR